jgi:hypothetical protein
MFRGTSQITKCNKRKVTHPLLLVRREGLIQRPPCISELLKVGCSLRQGIGSSLQESDGITVAQDFGRGTPALRIPMIATRHSD